MKQYTAKIERMLKHLAVGDALGKICSKYSSGEVISIYGHKIKELEAPIRKNSTHTWKKGSVTDDTILTLLVADCILETKYFDRKNTANRMISCDPRGGTQINKLKESKNPNYRATDGDTNGAAIRVLPLAATRTNLQELTQDVVELSTLTHGTAESLSGALLTSYSQFFVLNYHCHRNAIAFLQSTAHEQYSSILKTAVWHNLEEAFALANRTPQSDLADALEDKIGYSKYSWSSIPSAIALGFHSSCNYDTIIRIIHRKNSGGDLDTVASIAGSLLGGMRNDDKIDAMAKIIERENMFSFHKYAAGLGGARR